MNKALLILLLSVCLLGMALIMLNERLHGDNPKPAQANVMEPVTTVENTLSHTVPFDSTSRQEVRGEASMVARRVDLEQHAVPRKESALRIESRAVQRADSESRKAEREHERVVQEKKEAKVAENQSDKRKNEKESAKEKVKVAEKKKEAKVEETKVEKKAEERKNEQPLAVTNFVVFVRDNGATVRFDGNNDLRYKTMQMHNPERVLIEFEGKWNIEVPQIPKNEMVSQIRIAHQTKKTRVVLDLKANPRSCRFVQKRKENLDVRLDG